MSAHTSQTELKLIGKLILEGEMLCETGLHVGAGKGSLEIGGSDNPVVKDAFGRPYVPGSSLRGKIRSLLEQSGGLAVPGELVYLSRRKGQEVRIHQSDRPDDEICLLFGRNPGRMDRVQGESLDTSQATPARLAVFDAPLNPESITAQMRENLDDELTEVKRTRRRGSRRPSRACWPSTIRWIGSRSSSSPTTAPTTPRRARRPRGRRCSSGSTPDDEARGSPWRTRSSASWPNGRPTRWSSSTPTRSSRRTCSAPSTRASPREPGRCRPTTPCGTPTPVGDRG